MGSALNATDATTFYGRTKFATAPNEHGLQVGHSIVLAQWQKDRSGQPVKQVIWPLEGQALTSAAPEESVDLHEGQTPQEVEKTLGKPEDVTRVKETLIYTYPTVKVFFENGKLVNVEERKR